MSQVPRDESGIHKLVQDSYGGVVTNAQGGSSVAVQVAKSTGYSEADL